MNQEEKINDLLPEQIFDEEYLQRFEVEEMTNAEIVRNIFSLRTEIEILRSITQEDLAKLRKEINKLKKNQTKQ